MKLFDKYVISCLPVTEHYSPRKIIHSFLVIFFKDLHCYCWASLKMLECLVSLKFYIVFLSFCNFVLNKIMRVKYKNQSSASHVLPREKSKIAFIVNFNKPFHQTLCQFQSWLYASDRKLPLSLLIPNFLLSFFNN